MRSSEELEKYLDSFSRESVETPFLDEELFSENSEFEWEQRLATLELESPFLPIRLNNTSEGESFSFFDEVLHQEDYVNSGLALSEWKLATQEIVVARAKGKTKGTLVTIMEAPTVFLPEIIRMARDRAAKEQKSDLVTKLDPTTWFKKFTRITFLGRSLKQNQYLHLEMAKLMKRIESELIKRFGRDAKSVGDMLLYNSSEGISGSRLVSSTATFSMHMFGLAVDINRQGNPYIESRNDINGLNKALRNAALLMNQPISSYKKGPEKDKFDIIQQLDSTLEAYFSLLDKPDQLAQLTRTSTSPEWQSLSIVAAREKIQNNLNNLAGLLERGNSKSYFKRHGILNFDKRFVEAMEGRGLCWGGHYGDMMHFDMRGTGVGHYIEKARLEYKKKAREIAKQLLKEKKFGKYSLKDLKSRYVWELEREFNESNLNLEGEYSENLADELEFEDEFHSDEDTVEEEEFLINLNRGETQFVSSDEDNSYELNVDNQEEWKYSEFEDEAFADESEGHLEFADEYDTDEFYQDEMELETAENFELEAPPLLKNPVQSDPPGQTLYVQIALGKDKHCLKHNEKKECLKYETFTIRPMTGIYIPENHIPQAEVDLILYLHGHKTSIPGSDALIAKYWDGQKYPVFALREEVYASRKNVILVAPTLGLKSEAGDLVRRNGLDTYLEKVLDALKTYGPYQGQFPTLGNLILAAHSGAGIYMRMLAVSSNRSAGKIKECWGFDSLYNRSDVKPWLKWAKDNPNAKLYNYFYTKLPTYNSRRLEGKASNVFPIKSNIKDHFELVKYYLRERLRGASFLNNTRGSNQELSEFPLNELEDELYLNEDELSLEESEDSEEFEEQEDEQGNDLEDLEEEAYVDENEDWEAAESEIPSPLSEAIVYSAIQEWKRWDKGTKTETDIGMRGALRDYWMNLGYSQNEADQKIENRDPWSAAFISYVMRKAGAGNAFAYASAHTRYIATAKKAAIAQDTSKFWAYEISTVKPEVGDLVCRDRPPKTGAPCAGTNFANVDKGGISHSDIVVEVGSDYIAVLGGNTGQSYPNHGKGQDTVGQRKIKLNQQGFVLATQGTCPYFAIVKPPGKGRVDQSTTSIIGTIASLPLQLADAVRKGAISLEIALAIFSGERDVNKLTNMLFSFRHPELPRGYKIKPHENDLAREWLEIRDHVLPRILGVLISKPMPSTKPPITPVLDDLPKLGAGLTPPATPNAYRKFRLTTYHVVDQSDFPTGAVRVSIFDSNGRKIAEGSPSFFAKLSLEGTARLSDGRLINVTGKTMPVNHADYVDVLAYHNQAYARRNKKRLEQGRGPISTKYSGIVVQNGRVVQASAFHEIPRSDLGAGYGIHRGIPLTPFRTLAADIGHTKYASVEPKWKGKGGLVPVGTHVYIKEYAGLKLPDGTFHDGWFIVNDTGGGIFGAHFDVFVGTLALRNQIKLPEYGQIWFQGIEQRIPLGYTYGLKA